MLDDDQAFLARALRGRARVLEVGCGRGELALRLAAAGHAVTAIDRWIRDPPRGGGVRFVERDFLLYEDAPFDALLFVSSLHHIAPLAVAVERAWELLVPGGRLVADDFDVAAPDAATARWFYEAQGMDAGADPLGRWRAHHDHTPPLHTAAEMEAALAARFTMTGVERGPYLHRYAPDSISLADERDRIRTGAIVAVGARFSGEK